MEILASNVQRRMSETEVWLPVRPSDFFVNVSIVMHSSDESVSVVVKLFESPSSTSTCSYNGTCV